MLHKYQRILFILGLIVLTVISIRGVILNSGQIGHNWDFTFPYSDELFARMPMLSSYVWWPRNLGHEEYFTLSHYIPNTVLALTSRVIGAVNTPKLLIVVVIFLSLTLYKKLLDYLTTPTIKNFG